MPFNRETDKLYLIHSAGKTRNTSNLRVAIMRAGQAIEITADVAKACRQPLIAGREWEALEAILKVVPQADEITIAG